MANRRGLNIKLLQNLPHIRIRDIVNCALIWGTNSCTIRIRIRKIVCSNSQENVHGFGLNEYPRNLGFVGSPISNEVDSQKNCISRLLMCSKSMIWRIYEFATFCEFIWIEKSRESIKNFLEKTTFYVLRRWGCNITNCFINVIEKEESHVLRNFYRRKILKERGLLQKLPVKSSQKYHKR